VSGITLGGGPITGAGTLTLSGTISGLTNGNLSGTAGITNANLANSSVTIGSTAISLGSSATALAGLASVTSTNFIGTASLATTASYVLNAVSASYAPSAGAAFPYTGSAIISGSLQITGSLFVQDFGKTNIDSSNRYLYDAGPVMPPGASSVLSIDWGSRRLWDNNNITGVQSLNWQTRDAYDTSTSQSINWNTRQLWDGDPNGAGFNVVSLDWNDRKSYAINGSASIDWENKALYDNNVTASLEWDHRKLNTDNGTLALTWANNNHLNSYVYQTDIKSVVLQESVSSTLNNPDESYFGDIIEADGITSFLDAAVQDGMLVYLGAANTWYPVDQNSTQATRMLGIAHNVGFNGTYTGFVLLEGHLVIADYTSPLVNGAGFGLPVYIEDSTSTGTMSTTLPTTTGGNHVIRVLGHCYYNNQGNSNQWMMKFRPSNDWVQI
jgi:hypothetical protein